VGIVSREDAASSLERMEVCRAFVICFVTFAFYLYQKVWITDRASLWKGGVVYRQRPRILLADDHPMILEGLKGLLNSDFEVVGTATDGRALLEVAVVRRPDLVLVDISMPEIPGIEATRRLHDLLPETRVLIFSLHIDPEYVQAAFAAGACGFLTKTSAPEEIERAIREVLAGRFYVSPEITRAPSSPRRAARRARRRWP
jgi:DNA-binding NarL/FixJ family response regulator